MIQATAWNNGSHHRTGAGYGLKVSIADRDRHFKREWRRVELVVPGVIGVIKVNIDKASFWDDTCRELISAEFGRWIVGQRLAPWSYRRPPVFELIPISAGRFEMTATPGGTKKLPKRG